MPKCRRLVPMRRILLAALMLTASVVAVPSNERPVVTSEPVSTNAIALEDTWQFRQQERLLSRASRSAPRVAPSATPTPRKPVVRKMTTPKKARLVSTGSASGATAPSSIWYKLRVCESTNNYSINTGNGFYGAYQFDLRTWRGLGFDGYPHQASPSTQDRAARLLQSQRGWYPWPGCARKLGLI